MVVEYDRLTAYELRKLCIGQGLPAGGTKPALIARLTGRSQQSVTWEDPPVPPEESVLPPGLLGLEPPVLDTPLVTTPDPNLVDEGYQPNTRTYWVLHEVPDGELPTDGQHQRLLVETVRRAEAAGHQVRGGLYAGRRISYQQRDGLGLFVCYEVSVRSR